MREFTADSWQKIAIALVSILVTGAVAWFTVGHNLVTKTEVIDLIQNTSPYVYDRETLQKSISLNTETLQRVTDLLENHDREIVRHDERIKALER